MENSKVLIGVPTAESSRNSAFYDYFNLIEKPSGTMISFSHSQSPARNRNLIIVQALQNNASHILFLDDDVAPPPDILIRLLSHEKDIVTGLYLMRNYPHLPLIFDITREDGSCGHHFLTEKDEGLIEIVNCGFGAVLIKTKVFRDMNSPWVTLGEYEKDHWCDDISFFNRAKAAGFRIYCDLDVSVGHFTTALITPQKIDGKWITRYDSFGSMALAVPQAELKKEEVA
jgi:hypothetical protein